MLAEHELDQKVVEAVEREEAKDESEDDVEAFSQAS